MIKGCSRKVIVVKDPGSNLFEEAYFIVRSKESERGYGDLLLEANRIIRSRTGSGYESEQKNTGIFRFVVGVVLGIAVSLPMGYFLF